MAEVDIYPVGLFRDWRHKQMRRGLRYVLGQARDGNWRAVKNAFNGYLAEPRVWPAGVKRCGSGWTKRRALRDWQRRAEASGG